ncbi:molybdenum cofactor guanylyltransferase [Parasediminibacterium sp. JCM 36343]|uniref:molybdenum cofactor guanylyltransferase n=1 Tax=Parasediminibacterium sp. JCM 36343 TaxID=3374279 RepID=UPI003979BDE3
MIGIVTCGGKSIRMGADKGLLLHQSKTWAANAADILSSADMQVFISIRAEQFDLYNKIFETGTIILDETLGIGGPMKGIFSAHLQFPQEDLFVLACDMLLMQPIMIAYLIGKSKTETGDAFVFTNNGSMEPLCGVYTAGGLAKIDGLYRQQQLERFSMKYILSKMDTKCFDLPEAWAQHFKNYNAESDLNSL